MKELFTILLLFLFLAASAMALILIVNPYFFAKLGFPVPSSVCKLQEGAVYLGQNEVSSRDVCFCRFGQKRLKESDCNQIEDRKSKLFEACASYVSLHTKAIGACEKLDLTQKETCLQNLEKKADQLAQSYCFSEFSDNPSDKTK